VGLGYTEFTVLTSQRTHSVSYGLDKWSQLRGQ